MNTYFKKIIEEIKPEKLYRNKLIRNLEKIDFDQYEKIFAISIGKAASLEMKCLLDYFIASPGKKLEDYLVITKLDHSIPVLADKTIESTHPYLSEKSFIAGQKAREFIATVGDRDLIFCLISGGSSALIESYEEIEKSELMEKFNTLVDKGLNIDELNLLRKGFSNIKNGGLVKNCKGKVFSFLTSDIPNNDPYFIGSGPSLHKSLKLNDLEKLIKDHGFEKFTRNDQQDFSHRVNDEFEVLASYLDLPEICHKTFEQPLKCDSFAFNASLDESWEKIISNFDKRFLNLSFGELNIKVLGNGKGGRNTHFALFMGEKIFGENLLELDEEELKSLVVFSLGTDGSDGPTDAAGAWLSLSMFKKLDYQSYLQNFDSYSYFENIGGLIKTGPTGTNLMDLRGIGFIKSY